MARKSGSLDKYQAKRDFEKTAEPRGKKGEGKPENRFYIQTHDASRLHFDLRLEMDGVLRSWAVPKGPSLILLDKRLAVEVEDHPLDYGTYEGTIPKQEYGGGTVMLWDYGTYHCEHDMLDDYEAGEMKIWFSGKRMRGKWALILMKSMENPEERNWLFFKEKGDIKLEEGDDDLVERYMNSVKTGRSMDEIARGAVPYASIIEPLGEAGAKPRAFPKSFKPELATWVDKVPTGDGWIHEIKYDGYRIIALIQDGEVKLVTRNDNDWTDRFKLIAKDIESLGLENAVIDGEVVVLREDGITDFGALQNHLKGVKKGKLTYFAFDLPYFSGQDLTGVPLIERKEALRKLIDPASGVRYSDHIEGHGKAFFDQVCKTGLEGIISKRADSKYIGKRTHHWLKIKCFLRQEFVIGGYSEPGGSRIGFGALVLGYYDDAGNFIYCGRVGTGFDDALLTSIHEELKKREVKKTPFDSPPTGPDAKGVTYVSPELVCDVEFLAWTGEDRLRQPVFKGLRLDRDPKEVRREKIEHTPGEGELEPEEETTEATSIARPIRRSSIKVSHPDRVLYPDCGVTKGDVAEYLQKYADWILPHVAHRALALVRCPEGYTGECFFQKNPMGGMPSSIHEVDLGDATGISIDSVDGLVGLAQFGALEIHPWGSRVEDIERPDRLTFDLDPGEDLGWEEVVQGAKDVRNLLKQFGLESWVKTSGGKGLHVCVPIEPELEWAEVKAFCRAIAEILQKQKPKKYIAEMSKAKRKGKIFVDYLRNGRGATSVAAFSLRARAGAPISVPISWPDVDKVGSGNGITILNIDDHFAKLKADPWEDFFEASQSLRKLVESMR